MTPQETQAIREEVKGLRLAIQINQQTMLEKLDQIALLVEKRTRKPGWRLYVALVLATFLGWIFPR